MKAGQIIHVGNGTVLIDRIQTGGPGQLNIPNEQIFEVGNYKSVARVFDTPDLQFGLESLDVSTEIEQMLCGVTSIDPDDGLDLASCVPIDIASQLKGGLLATDPFAVIASIAAPFLYMESISYRFGLRDNATQQVSLRGDSIFYNAGPSYVQEVAGSGSAAQTVVTAHAAYQAATADGRRVLAVTVANQRLAFGVDYTETYGSVTSGAAVTTVHLVATVATTDTIRIIYASPTAVSYAQSVHPDTTVKPAAVRGRDIEIYLGGYDPDDIPGSLVNKLSSVQSVNLDWKANLDRDEEFGNHFAVATDFEVPDVSGSIDIKPRNVAGLQAALRKIAGVSDVTQGIGPDVAVPLVLDVVIKDPESGDPMKRLHVPDARFTLPGFQGRVQQKTTVSLPMTSDQGTLLVFDA